MAQSSSWALERDIFMAALEELIQMRQKDYYDALNEAGRASDSAVFVELMLEIIRDTLKATTVVGASDNQVADKTDQVINQTDQVKGQTDQVADQDGTKMLMSPIWILKTQRQQGVFSLPSVMIRCRLLKSEKAGYVT